MNKRRVCWHEAYFEAIKLELHEYRDALRFISEHQLSLKALIMDTLKYDILIGLDTRNAYINRLIQANENAFWEAYRVMEDAVIIARVLHTRQNWLHALFGAFGEE